MKVLAKSFLMFSPLVLALHAARAEVATEMTDDENNLRARVTANRIVVDNYEYDEDDDSPMRINKTMLLAELEFDDGGNFAQASAASAIKLRSFAKSELTFEAFIRRDKSSSQYYCAGKVEGSSFSAYCTDQVPQAGGILKTCMERTNAPLLGRWDASNANEDFAVFGGKIAKFRLHGNRDGSWYRSLTAPVGKTSIAISEAFNWHSFSFLLCPAPRAAVVPAALKDTRPPANGAPGDSYEKTFGPAKNFLLSIKNTHEFAGSDLRYTGFRGNTYGAPIVQVGTGYFVAATLRTPTKRKKYLGQPTVYRIDESGREIWRLDLSDRKQRSRYSGYELKRLVVTTDGGAIAEVWKYIKTSQAPISHFFRIDRDGAIVWDVALSNKAGLLDNPHTAEIEINSDGSVALTGVYERSSEPSGNRRAWFATLTSSGKLTDVVVGPVDWLAGWPLPIKPHPMWEELYRW